MLSISCLVRSVPEQEFSLVLLERGRVPADDLLAEVHLGAGEGQRRLQPHRGDGDAEAPGPVGRNALQGQREGEGVLTRPLGAEHQVEPQGVAGHHLFIVFVVLGFSREG